MTSAFHISSARAQKLGSNVKSWPAHECLAELNDLRTTNKVHFTHSDDNHTVLSAGEFRYTLTLTSPAGCKPFCGHGRGKKAAEGEAARAALLFLEGKNLNKVNGGQAAASGAAPKPSVNGRQGSEANGLIELNEWKQKLGFTPKWDEKEDGADWVVTLTLESAFDLLCGGKKFPGRATSKQQAKYLAAAQAVAALKRQCDAAQPHPQLQQTDEFCDGVVYGLAVAKAPIDEKREHVLLLQAIKGLDLTPNQWNAANQDFAAAISIALKAGAISRREEARLREVSELARAAKHHTLRL